MKAGWEIKKLGDVIQKTETVNPLNFPEYEFKYIDVSSISNTTFQIEATQLLIGKDAPSRARRKVKENDVLFATIRPTLRRIAIVPQFLDEQVCSTAYFVLRPKKGIDHRYIFYWLFSEEFMEQMEVLQKGASYPAVTDAEVKAQLIPVPPLPEQRRIVTILDEAFAGIAAAKEKAEQNLKNAKEVFEAYSKDIFSSQKEGWEEKTIDKIAKNLDSKRIPVTKNKRKAGNIPYYGASGVVDYIEDYIFDDDLLCISEDGANLIARTYPIAFSISGKTWVNNHAHVLKFKNMETQKFVEMYINTINIEKYVNGMAQPKLNQAMLNKIPVPFPPLNEQKIIVSQLDSLSEEINRLESIYQQKLSNLEELKKSLLQQAFSGAL